MAWVRKNEEKVRSSTLGKSEKHRSDRRKYFLRIDIIYLIFSIVEAGVEIGMAVSAHYAIFLPVVVTLLT